MKKITICIFLLSFLAVSGNMAFSADQWDRAEPALDTEINDYDVELPENNAALERLLYSHRNGLRIEYLSASAVTVETGSIMCMDSSGDVKVFRRMNSSTTVDWDDLDVDSEESEETYYIYATADTDIEGVVFKISLDGTSPDGSTYYRKIGSFYNDADSDITEISNLGEELNYYDSGWFSVTTSTTYTKTHDLGTSNILVQVFYSASSDGSDPQWQRDWDAESSYTSGKNIKNITSNTFDVVTMANGIQRDGTSNIGSGYYRVLAQTLQ